MMHALILWDDNTHSIVTKVSITQKSQNLKTRTLLPGAEVLSLKERWGGVLVEAKGSVVELMHLQ